MKRAVSIVFVMTLLVCLAWAQAPQAPAQAAPAQGAPGAAPAQGGTGRGGRAAITPRIVAFDASPKSIKPGESFLLSWSTEAGTGTIDNGIGAVPTRGTIKVTPKATTTYTITLGGGAVTREMTVTVAGAPPVAPAAADASATRPIPRINGKPDFSGIYGFGGLSNN